MRDQDAARVIRMATAYNDRDQTTFASGDGAEIWFVTRHFGKMRAREVTCRGGVRALPILEAESPYLLTSVTRRRKSPI
jgi:hypothetical protein